MVWLAGLVGLAAVLAQSAEDRLALDSVVGALAEQGVTVPIDLALIGKGDELPAATVDVVRRSRVWWASPKP